MAEIQTTQLGVIKINDLIETATILDSDYTIINSKGVTKKVSANLFKGLKGDAGKELELAKDENYIKWRYVGETSWRILIPLTDLQEYVDLPDYALKVWVDERINNVNFSLNSLVKVQSTPPDENNNLIWFETETELEQNINKLWFEV